MKYYNQARKYGAQIRTYGAQIATGSTALMLSVAARAEGTGFDTIIDSVDLSGVSAKVVALAVIVVGIALVFKGPDIAKRVIRKV